MNARLLLAYLVICNFVSYAHITILQPITIKTTLQISDPTIEANARLSLSSCLDSLAQAEIKGDVIQAKIYLEAICIMLSSKTEILKFNTSEKKQILIKLQGAKSLPKPYYEEFLDLFLTKFLNYSKIEIQLMSFKTKTFVTQKILKKLTQATKNPNLSIEHLQSLHQPLFVSSQAESVKFKPVTTKSAVNAIHLIATIYQNDNQISNNARISLLTCKQYLNQSLTKQDAIAVQMYLQVLTFMLGKGGFTMYGLPGQSPKLVYIDGLEVYNDELQINTILHQVFDKTPAVLRWAPLAQKKRALKRFCSDANTLAALNIDSLSKKYDLLIQVNQLLSEFKLRKTFKTRLIQYTTATFSLIFVAASPVTFMMTLMGVAMSYDSPYATHYFSPIIEIPAFFVLLNTCVLVCISPLLIPIAIIASYRSQRDEKIEIALSNPEMA